MTFKVKQPKKRKAKKSFEIKNEKVKINFVEGEYLYEFKKTHQRNPNGQLLYRGTAVKTIYTPYGVRKESMPTLYYTKKTLEILKEKK